MQNPACKVNFVENYPDEMNNCTILKHFKTGSGNVAEERRFHDIYDFDYWVTESSNSCYVLNGFEIDEYTERKIPVSYIVGFYENDYVYYDGRKFYTKDFPALVTIIHNRNVRRDLEVLE